MAILFVDDEKQVLRGIERMLDAAELDWDAEFASSGMEALEILAENDDFETLVTDMKMPGMDGAALLEIVSERFPHLTRIVLSGQADKTEVYRAVNPMHQYLSKPCDAETLRVTIQRASALREALQCDKLKSFVGGMSRLPSVPTVYHEIISALESDDISTDSIGELIAMDPAMTVKILQIANSAIFGMRKNVTSASRAATILGTSTLKSLVLSVGIFEEFKDASEHGFCIDALMSHSLQVAQNARKLTRAAGLGEEQADMAFTCGVVHDIGKLVMYASNPKRYSEVLQHATDQAVAVDEVELDFIGVDHASVGAHLLSIWGLPQSIVEVVALHHKPARSCETSFSVLTAVCVANALSHANSHEPPPQLFNYLHAMGCDQQQWADWAEKCS